MQIETTFMGSCAADVLFFLNVAVSRFYRHRADDALEIVWVSIQSNGIICYRLLT